MVNMEAGLPQESQETVRWLTWLWMVFREALIKLGLKGTAFRLSVNYPKIMRL